MVLVWRLVKQCAKAPGLLVLLPRQLGMHKLKDEIHSNNWQEGEYRFKPVSHQDEYHSKLCNTKTNFVQNPCHAETNFIQTCVTQRRILFKTCVTPRRISFKPVSRKDEFCLKPVSCQDEFHSNMCHIKANFIQTCVIPNCKTHA